MIRMSDGEYYTGLLVGMVVGMVVGMWITIAAYNRDMWDRFDAERACHPGMSVDLLSGNRALCVGGRGETWVVER